MTIRNPIVLIPGGNPQFQELPAGDSIGGASQGPVGMTWQGAWSSATSYAVDDVVSNNGSAWISLAASTNQAPPTLPTTSNTYWQLLASKGDTGATGSTGATGATGPAGTNGTNGAMSQLAQIVTASSQATVDFTSLTLTGYNAIRLVWFCRDTKTGTANNVLRVRFNNDSTAANYTATSRIGSQNASAFATTNAASTGGVYIGASLSDGNTAGIFSTGEMTVVGPGSTTLMKRAWSISASDDASTNGLIQTVEARWANTAAITRITFTTDGTAFKDGSTFTLYGF